MERFIGILGPLVHSRVDPYNNLANIALLSEQLRQIRFTHEDFRLNPEQELSEAQAGLYGTGHPVVLTAREMADLGNAYRHILAVEQKEVCRCITCLFATLFADIHAADCSAASA